MGDSGSLAPRREQSTPGKEWASRIQKGTPPSQEEKDKLRQRNCAKDINRQFIENIYCWINARKDAQHDKCRLKGWQCQVLSGMRKDGDSLSLADWNINWNCHLREWSSEFMRHPLFFIAILLSRPMPRGHLFYDVCMNPWAHSDTAFLKFPTSFCYSLEPSFAAFGWYISSVT